jgi:hypothetical protein
MPYQIRYWHPEALDWARRATANGGIVSAQTLVAVSDFCVSVDIGGVRSALYRVNLFCGGNLQACLVPLYRGPSAFALQLGNATETNYNFVSSDFTETGLGGGLKGNGTTKSLGTGFVSLSLETMFSSHLSFSATNMESGSAGVYRTFVGSYGGTAATAFYIQNNSNSNRGAFIGNFNALNFGFNSSEPHMIASRTSSNLITSYRSGISIGTNTAGSSNSRTSNEVTIFTNSNSVSACACRMYSVGTGLTSSQAASLSAAVIAFNAALGRA